MAAYSTGPLPGPAARWFRRLPATLAGAALPLGFAPTGYFFLVPILLAVLFGGWRTVPPREAALRGLLFGAAAFLTGTWWLYISVRLVGGTPLPVALLLLGGLVAIMAAWVALCGYGVARLRTDVLAFDVCLLAPAAWVIVEWLRGWVLTGFPWLSLGYGQIDGPLAAWAPVGGVYGVTFVTALLAGALLTVVMGSARERLAGVLVLALIASGTWLVGARIWTTPEGEPLRVSLVQGAVPQLLKWRPEERLATMELYRSMTAALPAQDLVIWPEVAVPAPDIYVADYLAGLTQLAHERHLQLLVGILTHDPERDEYRNSLLALGEPAGAYHKRHLVPFGEFFPVPEFIRRWMRMMNLPYSDLTRGSARQLPLQAHGVALAPSICYEDVYGAEQLGFLPASGLLVNVSNDAWFGDTQAPHQHLQMARMRALETGRYLVRATNTGITAIVDEHGGVRQTIPQFVPGVLSGSVQPFSGATPYVRTGNWPVLLFGFLVLACTGLWQRG